MASRSVHLALSAADRKRILATTDPEELVKLVTEDLEEKYLESDTWSFELDKAWNALHRSLTDGQLRHAAGPFPLAYAVVGGRSLEAGKGYTACIVEPEQVTEVAAALSSITRDWLRSRYFALDAEAYGSALTEEDFDYTWSCFEGLPEFFARAAKTKRSVLFTVDC